MEIGTSNRIPATPSAVQLVALNKPVSRLKEGTCLETIPLHVQTFTISISIATIVNELVKGNERFDKE